MKKNSFLFLTQIAYRNIYRNKRRTSLCILAVFMAVFFIIIMIGFIEGMMDSWFTDIRNFETGHAIVETKDYKAKKFFNPLQYPVELPDKTINESITEIEKIKGVKKALPRIISFATLKDNVVKNAVLWGINLEEELKYNNFNQLTKNKNNCLVEGRLPKTDKNECVIGYRLAAKMNVKVNDRIVLKIISSEYSDKFYSPVIVGLFDFDYGEIDKNYIIIPFERMQRLATLEDKTQLIFIYLDNYEKAPQLKDKIKNIFKGNQDILVETWYDSTWITYMKSSEIFMNITYLIFLIVSSFLIINTIIMIIHERIKEVGMMGALGMTRSEIVFTFFMEAVFLSLIGSALGALFGGLANLIGSKFPIDVRFFTGESFAMSNTIFFKSTFKIVLSGFIYGFIISSVCSIFPSLKVAFVKPVEALRR